MTDNPPGVLYHKPHVRVFVNDCFVSPDDPVKFFLGSGHLYLIPEFFGQFKVFHGLLIWQSF